MWQKVCTGYKCKSKHFLIVHQDDTVEALRSSTEQIPSNADHMDQSKHIDA